MADFARIIRVKLTGKNRTPDMHSIMRVMGCLLYTSDAADERSSVDLGGRRIIQKKKKKKKKEKRSNKKLMSMNMMNTTERENSRTEERS